MKSGPSLPLQIPNLDTKWKHCYMQVLHKYLNILALENEEERSEIGKRNVFSSEQFHFF